MIFSTEKGLNTERIFSTEKGYRASLKVIYTKLQNLQNIQILLNE